MRTWAAALVTLFIFCLVFLVLGTAANALTHMKQTIYGVYLSVLPAPIAAYISLRSAKKVLKSNCASKKHRFFVAIPVALLSFLGGLLPELERLVLNAAHGGAVVMSFLTAISLQYTSWALCFAVLLQFIVKAVPQHDDTQVSKPLETPKE